MKNREHVLIFLRNKKEDKIDSKTRNETTETLELHKISAPKQNQYSKLHHTINWWLIFVFQFVCESYIQNCACISTQLQYGILGVDPQYHFYANVEEDSYFSTPYAENGLEKLKKGLKICSKTLLKMHFRFWIIILVNYRNRNSIFFGSWQYSKNIRSIWGGWSSVYSNGVFR